MINTTKKLHINTKKKFVTLRVQDLIDWQETLAQDDEEACYNSVNTGKTELSFADNLNNEYLPEIFVSDSQPQHDTSILNVNESGDQTINDNETNDEEEKRNIVIIIFNTTK